MEKDKYSLEISNRFIQALDFKKIKDADFEKEFGYEMVNSRLKQAQKNKAANRNEMQP